MRRAGRGLRVAAWVLVPVGLVLAVGGFGWLFTQYQGNVVASEAMQPTYQQGDRILVERIGADEVRQGDVVLIRVPERYRDRASIQRVIGVGGDHVVCDGTRITVNGEGVDEPYVKDGMVNAGAEPYDVRVPEGRLFLLGDNRNNSFDARFFLSDQSGSVAASGLVGRVQDGFGALAVLGGTAVLGIVCVLVGVGLGIGGVRRRAPGAVDGGAGGRGRCRAVTDEEVEHLWEYREMWTTGGSSGSWSGPATDTFR
ncbi:signal peptidase I [Streptomyces sp. NPDC087440]|uniref:signal peptidase I n=1 Tax=Streptomyces sp. NPDC087440 TaxID=3365790 RepID=UPI0037F97F43